MCCIKHSNLQICSFGCVGFDEFAQTHIKHDVSDVDVGRGAAAHTVDVQCTCLCRTNSPSKCDYCLILYKSTPTLLVASWCCWTRCRPTHRAAGGKGKGNKGGRGRVKGSGSITQSLRLVGIVAASWYSCLSILFFCYFRLFCRQTGSRLSVLAEHVSALGWELDPQRKSACRGPVVWHTSRRNESWESKATPFVVGNR